jgi:UDP-N-acetylglucosamine 1-carboxyvinyltransferase
MRMSEPLPEKTILSLAIEGGTPLSGTVKTNTSKNGAVALLAASLLNKGTTTLHRMPRIEEVFRLIEVLRSIGVSVEWKEVHGGNSIVITPPAVFDLSRIDEQAARMTRSIILFIGPLVHQFADFRLPQAGGCKLGSRTVRPHFYAVEPMGVNVVAEENHFHVTHRGFKPNQEIVLYESGDTVTINAIMTAALIKGATTLKYASSNYQVAELCYFLQALGVQMEGVGLTTVTVHGVDEIKKDIEYTLSEDPIDAMFFLAAAVVTHSAITITRAPIEYLEVELLKLEKMGFDYTKTPVYLSENGRTKLVDITTMASDIEALDEKIYGRPYPGLNIDNLPFFAVIATAARGQSLIHDWAYDGRAVHFMELEKLGAHMLLADPHRVFVTGPTKLEPADLVCPPALRPAAILLIGMLAASGHSKLHNIYSIKRGYEDIAERLQGLGAKVEIFTE